LIGKKSADRRVSKLGDVMCICGLAVDFYENEKDENNKKKYIEIMKDAAKTAKLHYSTEHKIFMENALLGTGLDFSTPTGRLCNPGSNRKKYFLEASESSKINFRTFNRSFMVFATFE